jgi:hypothetical protein
MNDTKEGKKPPAPEDQVNPEQLQQEEPFTVARGVQSVIAFAVLIATIFTLWNPRNLFRSPNIYNLFDLQPSEEPAIASSDLADEEIDIGLLAGHWQNTTGEVCADGTIEADVNYEIANRLQRALEKDDYSVRVFPEFDLDLINYEADIFIALYSGSCLTNPPAKSGFTIGTSLISGNQIAVNNLAVCLTESYQEYTQLPFTYQLVDEDHSSFHIFRDVAPETAVVMIEIGSLSADRYLITSQTDTIIEGITKGIECHLSTRGGAVLNE